ncbi:MAG: starch phosphorylase [Verrucomicrobia bacterium]|jgi:starch phosphorylase|nr:MAG: starch phosphorylase [Verrucomicrobiota bacterium]
MNDLALSSSSSRDFRFCVDNSVEGMKQSILNHLRYTLAQEPSVAPAQDWWNAVCLSVRDRILDRSSHTRSAHQALNVRRVYYLSLEYLMGRLLDNNLHNSGLWHTTQAALADLGKDLNALLETEPDMGLGNGGLGRLAACFLDSMASLDLPSVGYGIYYEFGLFKQTFDSFNQVEKPDAWNVFGNPWEIIRPYYSVTVNLYGRVEQKFDDSGHGHSIWTGTRSLVGVPRDIPIAGYGLTTVNFLRLWESHASAEFNLRIFNEGGYIEAMKDKAEGETISKVLYPNDNTAQGRELRLVQEYFFVACSLQDIIRRHRAGGNDWHNFADKVAIQLNDTHPAIAVVELLRILVDQETMAFEDAWQIVRNTFAYTNHTLLPEALERWSVQLLHKVLPRHLELIYILNQKFLDEVVKAHWPDSPEKMASLSLIEETNPKMVRMAHLSVLGSHTTNGVAALHTRLLTERLFPDFAELFPGRFQNKTNGITPRRWLKACNPALSELIDATIGSDWVRDLDRLQQLAKWADDSAFQDKFLAIKAANKTRLAATIESLCGIQVDPQSLFDVQIKRLHEYKRQHLNLLHILALYRRLLNDPTMDIVPRVFIFAAKAAPGYFLAKHIIHCINAVAATINADDRIHGKLKVAFLPNYSVSLAERIIPAADLSEQISTAGKEASGTGNMKLALNGALTIGTLDGANVEILEEVGEDNIFIFGLTVEEAEALVANGYRSSDLYWANEELRNTIDWLDSGYFTSNREATSAVKASLLSHGDPFLVLADFDAYTACQARVDAAFRDRSSWAQKAILNTARVGKFSSDRTIAEYARDIWRLPPVHTS